jgi:hypothetical protein
MTLDDLFVELQAGGMDQAAIDSVMRHLALCNVSELTFVDYLAYMPLWIGIHGSIIQNPLHTKFESPTLLDARSRWAMAGSSEAVRRRSTYGQTLARKSHESRESDLVRRRSSPGVPSRRVTLARGSQSLMALNRTSDAGSPLMKIVEEDQQIGPLAVGGSAVPILPRKTVTFNDPLPLLPESPTQQ